MIYIFDPGGVGRKLVIYLPVVETTGYSYLTPMGFKYMVRLQSLLG